MSEPTTALGQAPAPSPTLDTNALIVAAVTPIASQVASDVAAGLHTESLALIDGLTTRLAANEQAIAKAGAAVLHTVETDVKTQQILLGIIVAGVVAGCLMVLGAYLLGNGPAAKIIAGVPAAAVGLVLWASKSGFALPTVSKTAITPGK